MPIFQIEARLEYKQQLLCTYLSSKKREKKSRVAFIFPKKKGKKNVGSLSYFRKKEKIIINGSLVQLLVALIRTMKGDDNYGFMCKKKDM